MGHVMINTRVLPTGPTTLPSSQTLLLGAVTADFNLWVVTAKAASMYVQRLSSAHCIRSLVGILGTRLSLCSWMGSQLSSLVQLLQIVQFVWVQHSLISPPCPLAFSNSNCWYVGVFEQLLEGFSCTDGSVWWVLESLHLLLHDAHEQSLDLLPQWCNTSGLQH